MGKAEFAEKIVALTFDDGPNTTTTKQVLAVLKENEVPGTFFLIGKHIEKEAVESVKEAFAYGCEIENHSKTHPAMPELTREQMRFEVAYTSEKIKKITGREPKFFRPPYIAVSDEMFEEIGLTFIAGIGCEDWLEEVSAQERADRILKQVRDGAVILLHDSEGNIQTVEALKLLIPELKKQGYTFVTVEELFKLRGLKEDEGLSNSMRKCYTFANQKERFL